MFCLKENPELCVQKSAERTRPPEIHVKLSPHLLQRGPSVKLYSFLSGLRFLAKLSPIVKSELKIYYFIYFSNLTDLSKWHKTGAEQTTSSI
jgi:hypothetical protein